MNETSVNVIAILALFIVVWIQQPLVSTNFLFVGQAPVKPDPLKDKKTHPIHESSIALKGDKKLTDEQKSSANRSTAQKKQMKRHQEFLHAVKTTDVTRLDLRKPSELTIGQADHILKGTGLEGLGKAFVEAEKKYQVNAYYLMAHAAWESGWGKSRISREKNNLFGYMAYDGSPYYSAKGFKTKGEGIDVVAKFISKHYLNKQGKYYNGPTLKGMNVRYASDHNWNRGIARVMVSLAKKTPPQEVYLV